VQLVSNDKAGMQSDVAACCTLNLRSRLWLMMSKKTISKKEIFKNKANSRYDCTPSLLLCWVIAGWIEPECI